MQGRDKIYDSASSLSLPSTISKSALGHSCQLFVVSDEDKGFVQFLLNLAKHFHHFTAAFTVQISCGLISKNDLRIGEIGLVRWQHAAAGLLRAREEDGTDGPEAPEIRQSA